MKRVGILLLAVIALVAMTGPVSAQPKVTITGFVDNMTTWNHNISTVDSNYARSGDTEWYARTRVRPDITAEVGTTKFVLGLEIDAAWGQTGAADNGMANGGSGATGQRFGTTQGWDLNTDATCCIEVKWAYTEFRLPIIPMATTVRLGAQPWQAQYKLAALANGDFAGIHLTSQLAPPVKLNATWGSVEEESTGPRDGFVRGEDHAFIFSVEFTPFKGLDIRPIYSIFKADSVTSGASRQARGGLGTTAAVYPLGAEEWRHTIGVDARWRMGPFSLDPTVFYQWGTRELAGPVGGTVAEQDRSAWFVDIRGGFQTGPLLLELAAIWTTGNSAGEDIRNASTDVNYYEPISTDTSYYATWAEQWALGIDYFNIHNSTAGGLNPGVAIGYDKYGLRRLGARASYAVTPAFTLRAGVTANWTDKKVDTDGTKAAATGITPGDFRGDDRYLGTELDLGFQWRFAPGLAFDMVGSYGWNGDAMATATATPGVGAARAASDVKDTQAVTARLRYNF